MLPPGCQKNNRPVLAANQQIFVYASTLTINVFSAETYHMACILNPKLEVPVKSVSVAANNSDIVAAVYNKDNILIFSVKQEKVIKTLKYGTEPVFCELNKDGSKLMVKDAQNNFAVFKIGTGETGNLIKNVHACSFSPFETDTFAYTSAKKVYLEGKNKEVSLEIPLKEGDTLSKLAWYNADEAYQYVLVATKQGRLVLVDLQQEFIVKSYEKIGASVLSMGWIKSEPGTFYTTHKGSGRINIWHVGASTVKDVRKASPSSVLASAYFPDDTGRIILSSENGSVCVYSYKHRNTVFSTEATHTETIFDVRFSALNSDLLATCSYDGFVNVWDVDKKKILKKLKCESGEKKLSSKAKTASVCVYSVMWSPREENLLISGDSLGMVRLWDIHKGKEVSSIQVSKKSEDRAILGLDWNDNNEIVIGCANGTLYSAFCVGECLKINEEVVCGGQVAMVGFSPFEKGRVAAACSDGCVRIYDFINLPKKVSEVVAHTSKCYGLAWSPLVQNLLATTGDDKSVNVHNLSTGESIKMSQHNNKSRWVKWSPTNENILVSGSWDAQIVIWDRISGKPIEVIRENYSDIYGIDFAPNYPNLLVSGSRDTSIRFWDLTALNGDYFSVCLTRLSYGTGSFEDSLS